MAQFSNTSPWLYTYYFTSEVLTNGQWEPGGLHHNSMMQAVSLLPHSSQTLGLTVLHRAATVFRLKLVGSRVPIGTEQKLSRFWQRLGGKRWLFTRTIEVFSPPFEMLK